MEKKIHSFDVEITNSHLDAFGHVNNATYLQLFEKARWHLMTERQYDLAKIKQTGLGPTILKIEISFLNELRCHDQIKIITQLVTHKNKIFKISQKMVRDDLVCCEAVFTMGLFSLEKRKLVLPTQDWLYVLGIDEEA